MRPLEIIIPILLAVHALCSLLMRHRILLIVNLLPFLALFVTIAHLDLEGYRWQMIPLYVLTAVFRPVNAHASQKGFLRSILRGWNSPHPS